MQPVDFRRRRRGQALLEYSALSWVLVVGLVLGCTVRFIPGPRGQTNLISLFLTAFQIYLDSLFTILGSAVP